MSRNTLLYTALGATAVAGATLYARPGRQAPSQSSGSKPPNQDQEDAASHRRAVADAKRNEGLGGAGVGTNSMTGGHETGQMGTGIDLSKGQDDPAADRNKRPQTTAPREKLPAGGVGGGVGLGGSNVRAVEKEPSFATGASGPGVRPAQDGGDGSGSGGGLSKLFGGRKDGGDQKSNEDSSSSTKSTNSDEALKSRGGAETSQETKNSNSSAPTPSSGDSSKTSISERLQGAFGQGGSSAGEKGETYKKFPDTKIHSNHADTPTKRG